jgi:DNA-binding MarR family transcriptional regulator
MSPSSDRRSAPRAEDLVDALVQTSFAIMAALTRVAAENDLSLTQLRVLAILADRRLRMTALADFLGLEKSTMSGLLDRAEKRGLMQRAPSIDDGRAVDALLTPAGRELVAKGRADVARSLTPLMERLTSTEQRRLQDLLERLLGEPAL